MLLINKDLISESVLNTELSTFVLQNTVASSLKYTAYNGCVTIDVIAGTSGTSYPIGTPADPVDNLADALENLFQLAAVDLGKNLGRYVLPIEDIKILIPYLRPNLYTFRLKGYR